MVVALHSRVKLKIFPFSLRFIFGCEPRFYLGQVFDVPVLEPRVPNEIAFGKVLILGETPVLSLLDYLFYDCGIITRSNIKLLLKGEVDGIHFFLIDLGNLIFASLG